MIGYEEIRKFGHKEFDFIKRRTLLKTNKEKTIETQLDEPEIKIVQLFAPTYAKRADGSEIKFPIRRGRKVKRARRNSEGKWIPLLNTSEKEAVKHMTNHQRCVFLRIVRLGITSAEYKLRCAAGK